MKTILTNYLLLTVTFFINSCNGQTSIDTLEFQIGYPKIQNNALEQLRSFPSPRYKSNNDFIRLYNWMSPHYMAGKGQKDISLDKSLNDAVLIQEELCINWNYMIALPDPSGLKDETSLNNPNSPYRSYINFANTHPEIPLTLTSFWLHIKPKLFQSNQSGPNVSRQDHPDAFYIADKNKTMKWKKISYAAPDSLFINDGLVMKKNIEVILKQLTRPINIINENGEEPPNVFSKTILENDPILVKDKNDLKIADWDDYIAIKKTKIRTLYSAQFMNLPELKNTTFTIYAVEGGPINRFDWHFSKTACSKIKGNYYSTPDFYPRTPDNWKTWRGAWHGWKWINDGRKVEIKDGDRLFSPFIAAGWDYDPKKDIRPAQWLGLLKCLSAVGAEFFYVGYFNLKEPFSLPENYVWQAAIPAYAQAITTHYSDILFDGNVLFDKNKEPIITFPNSENDVLVTVRKHNDKEKYIIATTVQPTSNKEATPLSKKITIELGNEKLKILSRRQGSVYIYDKTTNPAIFYQLDNWHQYEHPSRWEKDWISEAEVADSSSIELNKLIKSEYLSNGNEKDFTKVLSYIQLKNQNWVSYSINKRELNKEENVYLHLLFKSKSKSILSVKINNEFEFKLTENENEEWHWTVLKIQKSAFTKNINQLKIISNCDDLLIDRMIISNQKK